MDQILECIPNFSEGKNLAVISELVKIIESFEKVKVLDFSSDSDHHRSVITFAGDPEQVIKSAFTMTKVAKDLINLEKHKGVHPKIGATDVIPLVPIKGISESEAIKLSEKLGERIGKELEIPVYLYEKSAKTPERRNLADVRRGGFKNLKKLIQIDPRKAPDFGPKKLGTAGATAIGVRKPLIAFNVNLKSKNLEVAKEIAKKIRFSSRNKLSKKASKSKTQESFHFPCVKALGLELKDQNCIQISMNLTDYEITGIETVFHAIEKLAKIHNTEILESELIGLIPENVLKKSTPEELKIKDFNNRYLEKTISNKI